MSYTKIALIMACNYPGTSFSLDGCIKDAERIKSFLIDKLGFNPLNVKLLYDRRMTRQNMIAEIETLAAKSRTIAEKGQIPAIFLYYSGHGTQTNSRRGVSGFNDKDGNEALVPYDYISKGLLIDDVLNQSFIKRVHPTSQIFIMTDCCNSATNFDLKYEGVTQMYSSPDVPAKIVQLAGCRDNQYSFEDNRGGYCTTRFVEIFPTGRIKTTEDLRREFSEIKAYGSKQNPQVSVSNSLLINSNLFEWLFTGKTVNKNEVKTSTLNKQTKPQQQIITLEKLYELLFKRN